MLPDNCNHYLCVANGEDGDFWRGEVFIPEERQRYPIFLNDEARQRNYEVEEGVVSIVNRTLPHLLKNKTM